MRNISQIFLWLQNRRFDPSTLPQKSKYPDGRRSPVSRRLPMRTRTGDVYKLSHMGQPFWYCSSAILLMFIVFSSHFATSWIKLLKLWIDICMKEPVGIAFMKLRHGATLECVSDRSARRSGMRCMSCNAINRLTSTFRIADRRSVMASHFLPYRET
jgi:hypothetical protein